MKKKGLKLALRIAGILCAVILAALIGAYAFLNLYLVPKMTGVRLSDMGIGITDVVNTITDKQVIDNIVNFDKQSATEIMKAMNELEEEAELSAAAPDAQGGGSKTDSAANDGKNSVKEPVIPGNIDAKGAYQRIMEEASKEEISEGMAIISKLDIAKVNELRQKGNTAEVKAYVKSVLTPGEISTAVTLYNKYKHLL